MAEDKDGKTLAPTDKKLEDAAKRGEVATAPEMRHAILLAAMLGGLLWLGRDFATRLAGLSAYLWEGAGDIRLGAGDGTHFVTGLLSAAFALMAPMLLLLLLAGCATAFSTGRPSFSWTRLAPKWQKVSPVAGLKRLFGPQGLVEFVKTCLKCAAVLWLGWWLLEPALPAADAMVGLDPAGIAAWTSSLAVRLLSWTLLLVAALAVADLFWQRFSFRRGQRMDHKEMRDEHKESEGDPYVKLRQRQIGLERGRQRMMAAVPGATVVITNPTHYAVALTYDHGAMRAPMVVAKGADLVALKIRELATEAGVPLIENKLLARALYASAEVDRPIPVEQYAAVAEVISFVLKAAARSR